MMDIPIKQNITVQYYQNIVIINVKNVEVENFYS